MKKDLTLTIRLSREERDVLEEERKRRSLRSWGEVVRQLIAPLRGGVATIPLAKAGRPLIETLSDMLEDLPVTTKKPKHYTEEEFPGA